jgi:hypothetical protein
MERGRERDGWEKRENGEEGCENCVNGRGVGGVEKQTLS